MKIGYVPHSQDLNHPADRRRIKFWTSQEGFELEIRQPLNSDVLVLSNAANFSKWIPKARNKVLLDLVDGYLGEEPNFVRDFARNVVRTANRTSSLNWLTYTRHLKYACEKADGVIVASEEQRNVVSALNRKVTIIRDSHVEISQFEGNLQNGNTNLKNGNRFILWEGLGFTLKHLVFQAHWLDSFLTRNDLRLVVISNLDFPRIGGYIGRVKTSEILARHFPLSYGRLEVVEWSVENLVNWSKRSVLGIIPLNLQDRFAAMKPENKLLSMWTLGLPTLFSPLNSYLRVANIARMQHFAVNDGEWAKAIDSIVNDDQLLSQAKIQMKAYIQSEHTPNQVLTQWRELITSLDY